MTIKKNLNETELTVTIVGRLDTTTAPELETALKESFEGVEKLVLDFACLEYLSSAGLRVLLGAQKKMQKIGTMKVIHVCEAEMEVFEMTGFADILVLE